MATLKAKKVPPQPNWRRLPRTEHTRALEKLQPGQILTFEPELAATARQKVSNLRKLPGRAYQTGLLPDGSGRLRIYREA